VTRKKLVDFFFLFVHHFEAEAEERSDKQNKFVDLVVSFFLHHLEKKQKKEVTSKNKIVDFFVTFFASFGAEADKQKQIDVFFCFFFSIIWSSFSEAQNTEVSRKKTC
jgi:hypothetical protein